MMHRRKYCEIRFNWNNDGSGFVLIIVVVAQESKQPGMGSAIGGGAEGMMGENPAVKMLSFRNLPLCSVFYSPCFVLCSGGI